MLKYGLTAQEIDLIKSVFEKNADVREVFIFGSRARNTFKKTSDIDLAVVFEKKGGNLGSLRLELEELPIIYEIELSDEAVMTGGSFRDEYKRTKTLFYRRGWREMTLGEVALINPSESLSKGRLAKCVAMDCLESFTRKIPKFEVKKFGGGMKFRNGDILLARITPCLENGKTSLVDFLEENEVGFGSTEYIVIREKKDLSDKKFLYYLSISPRFREVAIKAMTGTSGRQRIQTEQLTNTKFLLPLLPEQRAIAAVLSSLDDKIELLREQNKTLEDIAQAIFREWFVEFNFPNEHGKPYKKSGGRMVNSELGEVPEGWKIGKFDDVTDIRGGTTPSTKNPNFWDGDIAWTSPKDISNAKEAFLLKTEKKITDEGLKQIGSGLLPKGTLLLSSRAPIGYLAISGLELAINQGYIAFLPNQYFSNHFMFLWLRLNMQEVINASNGSTFLEISKSSFRNIQCIVPNAGILENFNATIRSFFEKILENIIQIKTLSSLRDALLPRLMRGEIRVNGFFKNIL